MVEPVIPFAHHIVYRDDHLIVADKPHFLPVTPGGEYVNECLLARLQRDTGISDIAPLHRLDRDTAGLVLFSINPHSRPAYYQLFSQGIIEKQYQAVARLTPEVKHTATPQCWHIANRIEKSIPRFTNAIVPGEVNAVSDITLVAKGRELGLFELMPRTGKTHQLRLHLLSLGMPILHDIYYPVLQAKSLPQFDTPLQLLASALKFSDPVTGDVRTFSSDFKLKAFQTP
jgi:tRNA pseudouridine32 synthase/23S rRNA pseudouridine746 synthase